MQQAAQVSGLSTRAVNGVRNFVSLVSGWQNKKATVRALMEDVVKRSGMEALLKKTGGDELQELYNVNELITAAAEYDAQNPEGSLQDYLAQVSLVSDVDQLKEAGGAVTLMTLHTAKGLEFPVVAMIGLEEGCLPHARARDDIKQLEEERRLCFVGITRAQKRLLLSKAATRTIRGLTERTVTSPFLHEMPEESLEVIDHTGKGSWRGRGSRKSSGGSSLRESSSYERAGAFREGQMVKHPTFGVGRIAEISDSGKQTRAVVDFKAAGRKTLIVEMARLEPAG
jgi:DNA helicase-2/ATP-dependent DNA helicase PcrA